MLSRVRTIEVCFHAGKTPPVEEGDAETLIVVVMNNDIGKVECYPADYLNDFPLDFAEEDEGRTTGWFDHAPSADGNSICPMALLEQQEIVGWFSLCDLTDAFNAKLHS